jgi:PAS domain S-box-containing protein
LTSNSAGEYIALLPNGLNQTAYYLICASFGLVILGMAGNQWNRLKTDEYRRMAIAGGLLLLGSLILVPLLRVSGLQNSACLDWAFVGTSLAVAIWAYLFKASPNRRGTLAFVVFAAGSIGIGTLLCFVTDPKGSSALPVLTPGAVAPLLISGLALIYWLLNRRQSSIWLGCAFLVSLLGFAGGVIGMHDLALLAYLAVLPLLAIETYTTIIDDLGAYGRELQQMSDAALHQTQSMAFLLEVSQTIAASLEQSVILERVTESVARAVDADWAYFLLPSEDDPDQLILAAQYGWWGRHSKQDQRFQRGERVDLKEFSLLQHAATRRRQVLANQPEDYQQFERLHGRLARPQRGPTLVQPIHKQAHFLGLMLLGLTGSERTFDQTDGRLCKAIVAPLANAVDNARLHQKVDAQAERLARVLQVREKEATQRQAILDSIADGVVVADQNGEITLANEAALHILSLTRKQLREESIRRLYTRLLKSTAQQDGKPGTFQWGEKVVMGSLAPVEMPNGSLVGSVAVFHDVTSEQQAERDRSDYIASISRELCAPVGSIKGAAELLSTGAVGLVSPKQRHFLDIVRNNSDQVKRLINNLVAVSELEGGTLELEAQPVDMKQVVNEAVEAIQHQVDEKQLDVSVSFPRQLEPAWGDPQCLRQILDNLLDNAMRNSPLQGQVSIWATKTRVDDADKSPKDFLVISIRDTGAGIHPDDQDRIFERFYRPVSSPSWSTDRSRMSMAVVKSLVTAHRGQVWVDSEPGNGATFCFTIPIEESA